jgi:predicted nucleotidyltransferase component of viral defense system
LAEHLAFRGGTALFKLHLPPTRYSEDIDLVQVEAGPIGPVMDALQERLNPWLGVPKRKQPEGRVTLTYRVESEEGLPLKLKVEPACAASPVLGYARAGSGAPVCASM